MKLALTVIAIFMLLATLVAGLQAVKANPTFVNKHPITVAINSPQNNTYLQSSSLHLNFSIADVAYDKIAYRTTVPLTISAKLDENNPVIITDVYYSTSRTDLPQTYSISITNLTEGTHSLKVTAVYAEQTDTIGRQWVELSGTSDALTFTTLYSTPTPATPTPTTLSTPIITIISPQNNTYRSTNIPLNFTIVEPTTQISYSLNGQANITVAENTTLTDVPNGYHSLTLYAKDIAGNTRSETVHFTITAAATPLPSSPTQQSTPSPSAIPYYGVDYTPRLIIIVLVALAVVVGLLVYFKKKRR